MSQKKEKMRTKGRPPKFQEDSAPITITLPRRITSLLDSMDPDRAKAIVKCVEKVAETKKDLKNMVEIRPVSEDAGLIVVPYIQTLKKIPWIEFLEIEPFHYLLSIPSGTAIESLEIAIVDLLEHLSDEEKDDLPLLKELKRKISKHRRERQVFKAEVLFFKTAQEKSKK